MAIKIFGNAPCGYYRYLWKNNKETVGAKVIKVIQMYFCSTSFKFFFYNSQIFFYYANPVKGELSQSTKYKWLTRNELESSLPGRYFSSISDFLVDEK